MKKVLLVVIASLLALIAIQFASTASSAPSRDSAAPLARRVAKLEKQVAKLNKTVGALAGIAGCLVSQPIVPLTRYPGATLPSGGYLDITQQGGSPNILLLQLDPQCVSSMKTARTQLRR
jgi:hypothetical protein